jgi:hypothetical protein
VTDNLNAIQRIFMDKENNICFTLKIKPEFVNAHTNPMAIRKTVKEFLENKLYLEDVEDISEIDANIREQHQTKFSRNDPSIVTLFWDDVDAPGHAVDMVECIDYFTNEKDSIFEPLTAENKDKALNLTYTTLVYLTL